MATAGTIGRMHAEVAARPCVGDQVRPGIPDSPVLHVPDRACDEVVISVGAAR
ncbi:hypothetical protein [Streptomyces sp. NPDC058157]|uniref:hypothetical protein n=1 Tax=Streptomyces sp. NPDC058157 TaxID=3346360 RepID=UPI0036E6A392